MKPAELERSILQSIQGLPKEALQEVLDFIQFIRHKKQHKHTDTINYDLTALNESELKHLEQEFQDYKILYPINESTQKN